MDRLGTAGKRVLVTGGARGIGGAIAQAFFGAGASVVVADLDGPGATAMAQALDPSGARAFAVDADVSDEAQVEAMVRFAVDRMGGLDHAINSAGILGPLGPAIDLDLPSFERITSVNLVGTWLSMKHELMAMRGGKGSITNVSSVNGLRGSRLSAVYSASKHAVLGLTKSAALELAPEGIRINALCPGPFPTAILEASWGGQMARLAAYSPMQRIGELPEVAGAALFLASDLASYITGHALLVDGGMVA